MITCTNCFKEYQTREGNFYKDIKYNSGFKNECIDCFCRKSNYTRKKQLIAYEKALGLKIRRERKARDKASAISKGVAKTIQNKIDRYSKKLYWQEDKKILADVKFCEW
jgi:hypothetical protein|tara:strand:+ start:63 stop:389 length:327 start_codon:yes stop_codon:yes gene_type:complete